MNSKAPVLILMLLTPVLSAGECSEDKSNPLEADEFTAVVDLLNERSDPIHIFAPGEDFPCCRVDPQSIRNVTMTLKPGSSYTFRAGRLGAELARVSCTVPRTATGSERYAIFWEGDRVSCPLGWE